MAVEFSNAGIGRVKSNELCNSLLKIRLHNSTFVKYHLSITLVVHYIQLNSLLNYYWPLRLHTVLAMMIVLAVIVSSCVCYVCIIPSGGYFDSTVRSLFVCFRQMAMDPTKSSDFLPHKRLAQHLVPIIASGQWLWLWRDGEHETGSTSIKFIRLIYRHTF